MAEPSQSKPAPPTEPIDNPKRPSTAPSPNQTAPKPKPTEQKKEPKSDHPDAKKKGYVKPYNPNPMGNAPKNPNLKEPKPYSPVVKGTPKGTEDMTKRPSTENPKSASPTRKAYNPNPLHTAPNPNPNKMAPKPYNPNPLGTDMPDGTTMEGMIWNANNVLEDALKPNINGVAKGLFGPKLKGIVLLSVVEVGVIFSGCVGSGILLSRKSDGSWSPPSAMGVSGIGWGLLVGESVRDVLIFLYDEPSLASATSDGGLKVRGQMELAIGNWGRSTQVGIDKSSKDKTKTFALAFAKGAFLALSMESAVLRARNTANHAFYGKPVSPKDIVLEGKVSLPEKKVCLINEVYDKLGKLSEGEVAEPTPEEEEKKSVAKSVADEAAVKANEAEDVVEVDAAAEAAKESAGDAAEAAEGAAGDAAAEATNESS